MIIGAMNHPAHDVVEEIRWMAEMGLGFIDLTLEPPAAAVWRVDAKEIRAALRRMELEVVGHTAYYLPIASAFESIRRAAVEELLRCIESFAAIGSRVMNIHPDRQPPMHDRAFCIDRNLQSLRALLPAARATGVRLMLENVPEGFNSAQQLSELLDPLPEIGLHMDIGHANLRVMHNTTEEMIRLLGARLMHVHLHDNKGGTADLHLPLGGGTLDVQRYVRSLKHSGYDGTITLEVFTPDRHYLAYSRDSLRRLWDES